MKQCCQYSMRNYPMNAAVKIIDPRLQSYGLMGRIIGCNGDNGPLVVKFDKWLDDNEKVLYFKSSSLEIIQEENMANNVVTGNYDVAMVRFLNAQPYDKEYAFALFDTDVNAGDFVLVDASNDYKVTKVTSIIGRAVYQGTLPTKEIVCKVDFSEFERRKQVKEQRRVLKKKMDELLAKNQELILYQAIVEKNPEMAAMLEEYKALEM